MILLEEFIKELDSKLHKTQHGCCWRLDMSKKIIVRDIKPRIKGFPQSQNFPKRKLSLNNISDLRKILIELNKDRKIQKKKEPIHKEEIIRNFIKREMIEFLKDLENQGVHSHQRRIIENNLEDRFLSFFFKKNELNFSTWPNFNNEIQKSLIDKNYSYSVIKNILSSGSRFLKFLHRNKTPNIFEHYRFSLSPQNKKLLKSKIRKPNILSPSDQKTIESLLSEEFRPIYYIGLNYGLRLSEIRGLELDDVRQSCLMIERQKSERGKIKQPKCEKSRQVPHWNISPSLLYNLISQIKSSNLKDPLRSNSFLSFIRKLKSEGLISHNYRIHDLRHTFISEAVRTHDLLSVRDAAGHSDISMTNKYLHSLPLDGLEIFKPDNNVGNSENSENNKE
jgi:integrase